MNVRAFLADALDAALALGIGTPEDVIRHVTPDVLAAHLPRPLWGQLLSACLGAQRLDPRFVIETLGVATLCEHVPSALLWQCVAEIGSRSLGDLTATRGITVTPKVEAGPLGRGTPLPFTSPPPSRPESPRVARTTTARREEPARALAATIRRPDAATTPSRVPNIRHSTELEPAVESSEWDSREVSVDDGQFVDWETDMNAPRASALQPQEDFSDLASRKR